MDLEALRRAARGEPVSLKAIGMSQREIAEFRIRFPDLTTSDA